MWKKWMAVGFALTLAVFLSTRACAQEGSKQESMKDTPSQKSTEGKNSEKQDRWEGVVIRSSKDKSALTVRQWGGSHEKTVYYDSSTHWVSQEHGSKKVNDIDASQVKDGDRVIALGTDDGKGGLHATVISKRLTPLH
jgi:hypothetical protein